MIESLNSLMGGFAAALTPGNLLFAGLGVLLGTAIGVLPGIGPAMAVALLLPVTYAFDPPARSSCSPASTSAPCSAGPPPRSCSTPPARAPR